MDTDPAGAFTVADMQDCFAPAAHCWCGWAARTPSVYSPRYHRCARCGTHYSAERIRPEAVTRFYGFRNYWQDRNQLKQHERFEDRAALFTRQGRLAKWLSVVERHHSGAPGLVCEIGCAEGTFLSALRDRGWTAFGLEPDAATAAATHARTGLDIRAGAFPCALDVPPLDAVVALDVLEHAADPRAFLAAVRRLLKPEGFVFLQSPILGSDPAGFGALNNRAFDAQEHAFLFTRESVSDLLAAAGFAVVENHDAWGPAHEIVVARPLPDPAPGPRPLANLAEMLSPEYAAFAEELYAFAQQHGLAAYDRSPRTWELPRLWTGGLRGLDWRDRHLVDLGSEVSPWPWWIATQGTRVTLVEIRRDWIPLWERLRQELGVQVDWVFTDSDAIPLPAGCADVVTSVSVIEHQQDKALALAELERVLRPGGTLALSCDIFEPGLGMTYPEWNGRALGAAEFDDRLGALPALTGGVPAGAWNWADVRPFLAWFRRTAPHHNYAMAAAVLRKQGAAPAKTPPAMPPAVLLAQPDDAAGVWAAAPWLSAWARQESARPFFWIVPASEEARLLELLPHATRQACNTEIAPRLAARALRLAAPTGLHLLVAPFSAAAPWSRETHRLVLWWRDFLGELRAALALLPDGEPTWSAAFTIAASQAPDCRYAPLPPEATALLRHATEAAGLPLPAAATSAPMPALSVAAALAARLVAAGAPAAPDKFPALATTSTILLIPEGFAPRWPQRCWEALAQQLQARGTPVRLLDASACAALTLADLRAAAGVVCAEGPFAPMAATSGVPVVVVAGGAEPDRWAPDVATAKLVQGLPACRGCGRTCLLAHPACVEAIPVEAVATALHALRTTGDRTPLTVPVPLPDNLTAENLPSIAGRRLRQLAGESQAAERRFGDSVRELEAARHTAAALREENGRLGAQVLQLADDSQHRLEHIHTIETRIAALDRENASRLEHIHLLETRLTDCERDRETRLAHIHEIERRLAASETDREARLQHIHALEARLLGRPTGDAGTPPSAQP